MRLGQAWLSGALEGHRIGCGRVRVNAGLRTSGVPGGKDHAVTGCHPARGRLDSAGLFWQIRGPQTLTPGPTGLPET